MARKKDKTDGLGADDKSGDIEADTTAVPATPPLAVATPDPTPLLADVAVGPPAKFEEVIARTSQKKADDGTEAVRIDITQTLRLTGGENAILESLAEGDKPKCIPCFFRARNII